jgi:hypothetical protein
MPWWTWILIVPVGIAVPVAPVLSVIGLVLYSGSSKERPAR